MNPRDDERRKFEARFGERYSLLRGTNVDYFSNITQDLWELFQEVRAEQAETPQTREELEKEWLAQTEWQDFTNWLIHVKLSTPALVEDRPAPTLKCGNEFALKHGYFCELPKGHEGDHEAECPNPQFHQSWPQVPEAPTPEKCNCDAYDYAGMKHKKGCPFYKIEVAPEKE